MSHESDWTLAHTALQQAERGDLAGARVTLAGISETHPLRYAWIMILRKMLERGELREVKDIIASFPNDSIWRGSWVWDLVVALTKQGDVAGAIEIVDRLTVPSGRHFFLSLIVMTQAKRGDYIGAEQTLSMIPDQEGKRDMGLVFIAKARAESSDIPGAMETLSRIDQTGVMVGGLRAVATAQARAGDIQGAQTTAAKIQDEAIRIEVLGIIQNLASPTL
jgi:hypothetical protein